MIVDGGDLYHIDNLAMSHCMNASFEEIECRNHRQLYSLQLLQSMHHLLKRNKTIYQSLFNEVLDDLDLPPEMIRSMRERQQYWIANERNTFYQKRFLTLNKKMKNDCITLLQSIEQN